MGALAAGGPLLGHRGAPGSASLHEHRFHGGDELGSLHHLDLGVQLWLRQFAETARQSQQPTLLSRFGRCLGLLGRRALGLPVLQGLGEGVRPPVRRYVRDHRRHLLSS